MGRWIQYSCDFYVKVDECLSIFLDRGNIMELVWKVSQHVDADRREPINPAYVKGQVQISEIWSKMIRAAAGALSCGGLLFALARTTGQDVRHLERLPVIRELAGLNKTPSFIYFRFLSLKLYSNGKLIASSWWQTKATVVGHWPVLCKKVVNDFGHVAIIWDHLSRSRQIRNSALTRHSEKPWSWHVGIYKLVIWASSGEIRWIYRSSSSSIRLMFHMTIWVMFSQTFTILRRMEAWMGGQLQPQESWHRRRLCKIL